MSECAISTDGQCCCQCAHHIPTHKHCCTDPDRKSGTCSCGEQTGWACVPPEFDRAYPGWPEHSCGCELFTQKTT